jgi:hypothetical protein
MTEGHLATPVIPDIEKIMKLTAATAATFGAGNGNGHAIK